MKKKFLAITLTLGILGGVFVPVVKNVNAASITNQTAFCVGTDYRENIFHVNEINSTPAAQDGAATYSDMGWDSFLITIPTTSNMRGTHYNGYSYFESSILLLAGHGNGSTMTWNYGQNGGNYQVGIRKSSVDYTTQGYDLIGVGQYELEQNDLVILLGCSTATDTISLAKYFVNNGAETSIGWNEDVSNVALGNWLEKFNDKLATNSTVQAAVTYANSFNYLDNAAKNNTIFGNGNLIPKNKFLLAKTTASEVTEELNNVFVVNQKVSFNNKTKNEDMMKLEIEKIIKEKINSGFDSENFQVELNGTDEVVYDYVLYSDGVRTNLGYSVITRDNEILYIRDNTNGKDIDAVIEKIKSSKENVNGIAEKTNIITQRAYEITQEEYSNSTCEILKETLYYDADLNKLFNVSHVLVRDNELDTRYVVEHVEEIK